LGLTDVDRQELIPNGSSHLLDNRGTFRLVIDQIVIRRGDTLPQAAGKLGEMLTAVGAPRDSTAVGVMVVAGHATGGTCSCGMQLLDIEFSKVPEL
jgi:hypothetical protein